jgi:aspartate-semialdehyde dehydrogenase
MPEDLKEVHMSINVAVLGATGAVGGELLALLEERRFPVRHLKLLASGRSAGKRLRFAGEDVPVEEAGPCSFRNVDLVLSSAGGAVSRELLPHAVREGAVVVDNTSYFRMDPEVPLVVPEVNADRIADNRGIIANPNCNAIILSLVLAPLHREFGVERVHIASYQAASGAGLRAMEELKAETAAVLAGKPFERSVFPQPYAFNCFIHNTRLLDNGYVEEEMKVVNELRKILGDPAFNANIHCVRVPTLRAHGEALNVRFRRDASPEAVDDLLSRAHGVRVMADRERNRWCTPLDASGQDEVLVGRVRRDLSQANTLDLWIVGDQIRKGAALNAVQIAELLFPRD